jgi:hypothetical protein
MLRVTDERPVVSRARLGAVAGYLLLPELAVFVLIGVATSWWVAGLIAAGTLGAVVLAVAATRSTSFLGRAFGTAGYDPFDYTQWTHQLVVRPFIESLPVSLAVIVAIVLSIAYDASVTVTIVVTMGSAFVGFLIGAWFWLWLEERRDEQPRASDR